MTAAMLIELAAKSIVVSGLSLLLLRALKGRSAAERSWVAHAGLVVLLLMPLGALVLPSWQMGGLVPEAPAFLVATAPDAPAAVFAAGTGAAASPGAAAWTAASPITFDLWMILQALYLIGAGALFLVVLTSVIRLFALQRRSAVLVDAEWLTALARAQRRMGVKYGAALLVSGEINSPLSWGLLRPTILLSENVVSRHGDAEAIIAHELAHVVRFDWAKLLLARAVTALFWFNPLVWMLARQCHQLREEAADDAVLQSDVPCEDYAALLVGAARHDCKASLLAAHGVAPSRGSLRQRVTRVLDDTQTRVPAAAAWAACCLVGASLVGGPLSAITLDGQPGERAKGAGSAHPKLAALEQRLDPPLSVKTTPSASSPLAAINPAPTVPAAPPPPAAQPVPTEFRALDNLSSIHVTGGMVILSYGETASVQPSDGRVIASVDAAGRMTVTPCKGCKGGSLRVTSPTVPPLSVEGGSITANEGFPAQAHGSASVRNGGLINLFEVTVEKGEAHIEKGGQIMLRSTDTLNASVKGGGNILYLGDPALNSIVRDGGWVAKIAD